MYKYHSQLQFITVNYKKYHRSGNSIHIHLKFKNKLIIFFFFSLFKDRAYTETYRDHDVISYLHHTVVTIVEPASPPTHSHDSLPNFTVNKSRTVRFHKNNKFGFIRHHDSGLIVYN